MDLTTTDGREIPLTKLEHALFRLLVVNSDREVTVEDISRQIYRGPCTDGNRSKLTMLVHRLRNKLKKYSLRERLIVCSHNKGYRFNATLERVG
jgi:DNA-binding response OmpR family regulator